MAMNDSSFPFGLPPLYAKHIALDPPHFAALHLDRLLLANADGSIKPGLLGVFQQDELIVLKGVTFKVVYLNEKSVTLEPLGIQTLGEASTDD